MKKEIFFCVLFAWVICISDASAGASGHAGHEAGSGSGSAGSCVKVRLSKFQPERLATVVPGAEISFYAVNVQDPEQIQVTVKNIPIALSTEENDSFMLVKGKVPAELQDTAARINIKVKTKASRCDAEDGWLVKISH
ncbi:MAG: hypothetical protein WC782_02370 [Methylococcaceae bacterium]|jgi:hypothetical protein